MNNFLLKESEIEYKNLLELKSFDFAKRVLKCFQFLLVRDNNIKPIYQQLLKSGTSIGANISEAKFASSRKDFSNKLQIALKEANETNYWLKLFYESEYLSKNEYESLSTDCNELIKILVSSINTLKSK